MGRSFVIKQPFSFPFIESTILSKIACLSNKHKIDEDGKLYHRTQNSKCKNLTLEIHLMEVSMGGR